MPTVNFYFSDEPEGVGHQRQWLAVPRIGDKVELLTMYPGDSTPRRQKTYVAGMVMAVIWSDYTIGTEQVVDVMLERCEPKPGDL